jgi:hypothetical protein
MSPNSAESIYQYSHANGCLVELIASRRQIECKKLGKGYVNNWTTESFADFIGKMKAKYPNNRVFVCRDHGGPWQGDGEASLPFDGAMARAKTSYEADILSGFDLLHIDPSLDLDKKSSLERTLGAGTELLLHCSEFAKSCGKKINFEIGTEENVGKAASNDVFEESLQKIIDFCSGSGIQKPLFVVGQTGSLVKEMRQVGNFDQPASGELAACARRYGVFLKEHNGDYLSEYQLCQRLAAGVMAINVAPEFGVIESRAFVDMCMEKGKAGLAAKFLQLSIESGKWKKWVIDTSNISDFDRGIVSGHYVFATAEFAKIKAELDAEEFDSNARQRILERIDFYCRKRPIPSRK